MPKMKSHRGASKRFRTTKNSKIKRSKAYASHKLSKKSSQRKRNLRKATYVADEDAKRVRKMILG